MRELRVVVVAGALVVALLSSACAPVICELRPSAPSIPTDFPEDGPLTLDCEEQ